MDFEPQKNINEVMKRLHLAITFEIRENTLIINASENLDELEIWKACQ